MVARLVESLGTAAVVELTQMVALENMRSRFNSAAGMQSQGYSDVCELPLAVPVIAAGMRVAAVSNVSIVSVAALIGVPQLGSLFTDGFTRGFLDPIVAGLVACVLLSLAFDLVIIAVARLLTPWTRSGGAAAGRSA